MAGIKTGRRGIKIRVGVTNLNDEDQTKTYYAEKIFHDLYREGQVLGICVKY